MQHCAIGQAQRLPPLRSGYRPSATSRPQAHPGPPFCLPACSFGHGFGRSLLTILSAVAFDFLGLGCLIATAGWALSNRFLRRTNQHSHAVEQSVEWCVRASGDAAGCCSVVVLAALLCLHSNALPIAAPAWLYCISRSSPSGRAQQAAGCLVFRTHALPKTPFLCPPPAPPRPSCPPARRMYAFDVHCNAFFPMFLLLYVLQLVLSPLLLMHTFLSTLLSAGGWVGGWVVGGGWGGGGTLLPRFCCLAGCLAGLPQPGSWGLQHCAVQPAAHLPSCSHCPAACPAP